jgi:hypothetical protein
MNQKNLKFIRKTHGLFYDFNKMQTFSIIVDIYAATGTKLCFWVFPCLLFKKIIQSSNNCIIQR